MCKEAFLRLIIPPRKIDIADVAPDRSGTLKAEWDGTMTTSNSTIVKEVENLEPWLLAVEPSRIG